MHNFLLYCYLFISCIIASCQHKIVYPGIEATHMYFPALEDKYIAIFSNQTSLFNNGTHLVDSLYKLQFKIKYIYAPEHGFRGKADAGEHINNTVDAATGIPIISMYGTKKQLSKKDVSNIDIIIFDIQDVGTRFYTYISSLEYIIKACMLYGKKLVVLDRPNPHINYIDGPILEKRFKSFVGMQSIPIIYGMTIGEYAKMLVGENWVLPKESVSRHFNMQVIACENYNRNTTYNIPIPPSPNLTSQKSILLYPSLCFFEGTPISVGRGTNTPFEIYGNPALPSNIFSDTFIPQANQGNKNPPYKDQACIGEHIKINEYKPKQINLKWLLKAYMHYKGKSSFFTSNKQGTYFFDKLAGTDKLRLQIERGLDEKAIRQTWKKGLKNFASIRKKYLLY